MDYTYLGHTGAKVSRLCLGTMNFGTHTPEDESHTIMDAALDLGINFFDTANAYGRSDELGTPKGRTEEIIGNWFAKGAGRRDRVVLATKVFGEMPGGTHPLANEGGLSRGDFGYISIKPDFSIVELPASLPAPGCVVCPIRDARGMQGGGAAVRDGERLRADEAMPLEDYLAEMRRDRRYRLDVY